MSARNAAGTPASRAVDPARRAAILHDAAQDGVRVASERHGVPQSTIWNWQSRGRKRAEIVPAYPLKHGAYSRKEIGKRAEIIHNQLLVVAPWLNEDHFAPAVNRYLIACAREQLAHEAVMSRDLLVKGSTRLLEVATTAARLAAKLGSDLGLDPIGHARLKATAASAELGVQSLEQLAAEGEKTLARRKAQLAADATAAADDAPGDQAPEQEDPQ
jgi:hypothetical protein